MGSGVQTAAAAVASGMIGDVTGFTVMLNRGLELLYHFMGFLTQPGGGIAYDFGVYALTALFSILGPATEVCGFMQTNRPVREYTLPMFPQYRQRYIIENENMMVAAVRMQSGVLGSITFNGDSTFPERPYISIQGTLGLLQLPDPNSFGGAVLFTKGIKDPMQIRNGNGPDLVLPVHHKYAVDSRGIGAADMACAIDEGRPHRASADLACHLLEMLDGVADSCRSKQYTQLKSSFEKPKCLNGKEVF